MAATPVDAALNSSFVLAWDRSRPIERFFDFFPNSTALGSISTSPSPSVLNVVVNGTQRIAGIRFTCDNGTPAPIGPYTSRPNNKIPALVVDVLVPDASIISETTAPDTEPLMKGYFNTRSLVGDTFSDLCNLISNGIWENQAEIRTTIVSPPTMQKDSQGNPALEFITNDGNKDKLKVLVALSPTFSIEVCKNCNTSNTGNPVWTLVSRDISINRRFVTDYNDGQNLRTEYSTYWQRQKLPECQYLGFGEKGGQSLCMTGKKLAFVNLDNYMYSQVYGNGPTDPKEPLYHSNPFWLEVAPSLPNTAVGVYLDTVAPSFIDGESDQQRLFVGTLLSRFHYYIIVQDNCYDVLQLYCRLVGQGRLFPKWVLGYHQGKFGWKDMEEVRSNAARFRAERIPIDGFNIDIDIQDNLQTFSVNQNFQGIFTELANGYGIKSSTNITPYITSQVGDVISAINQSGIDSQAFVANFCAAPVDQPPQWPNPYTPWDGKVAYSDACKKGHYPDLGAKHASSWWQRQYDPLIQAGLSFVWQDMVTPDMDENMLVADLGTIRQNKWKSFHFPVLLADNSIKGIIGGQYGTPTGSGTPPVTPDKLPRTPAICMRNLYALNLLKSTFYAWDNHPLFADKRPFIIGRGGCSGMHRFGALWTGDNTSTWDFLKTNLVQCLALGMSGQYMSGADIGGFAKSYAEERWAGPELYMRWHLAGSLLPWYRCHYDATSINPWPNYDVTRQSKDFQEVWAYGDAALWVPEQDRYLYYNVLPVCKFYIEMRYRLIQLLYDGMFNSVRTGIPIVRPLFVQDGGLDDSLHHKNSGYNDKQYFAGANLLVAPILQNGVPDWDSGKRISRAVTHIYLPAGSDWYQFMNSFAPLDPELRYRKFISPGCRSPPYLPLNVPYRAVLAGNEFDFDASFFATDHPEYVRHLPFLLPMFFRAGSIIPTVELEQYVGERREKGLPDPVTVNIFPSPETTSSKYDLYLDDDSRAACPVRGSFDTKRGCGDQYYRFEITSKNVVNSVGGKPTRTVSIKCANSPSDKTHWLAQNKWLCVAFFHDPSCVASGTPKINLQGSTPASCTVVSKLENFYYPAGVSQALVWTDTSLGVIYVRLGNDILPVQRGDFIDLTLV